MNLKEWANTLELEEVEFLEILELFIKTSTSDLGQLEAAIEEGDHQQVLRAAHSIKGTAANLGLMEIYEIAKRIERGAKENRLEGMAERVRVIKENLERINDGLLKAKS